MNRRDMSKAQFVQACKRRGYVFGAFGGYVQIVAHANGGGFNVSRFNGGKTYREQLAYLIRQEAIYRKQNETE